MIFFPIAMKKILHSLSGVKILLQFLSQNFKLIICDIKYNLLIQNTLTDMTKSPHKLIRTFF